MWDSLNFDMVQYEGFSKWLCWLHQVRSGIQQERIKLIRNIFTIKKYYVKNNRTFTSTHKYHFQLISSHTFDQIETKTHLPYVLSGSRWRSRSSMDLKYSLFIVLCPIYYYYMYIIMVQLQLHFEVSWRASWRARKAQHGDVLQFSHNLINKLQIIHY